MRKGEQIKTKRHPQHVRSPQPLRPQKNLDRHVQEAVSVNYQITVRAEKPRKCSDKLPAEKVQHRKKVKFITESIDQSTHDLLSARSKSNHRGRSPKLSPHNAEEENAYELMLKASKRSQQGQRKSKSRAGEEGERRNVNPGNIKLRREKSHSKEKLQLNLKLLPGRDPKSTKKTKNGTKSSRKSQKNKQPKRFLSPELVKMENSYYFSNYDEEQAKPSTSSNALVVPKKQSKFIFESNQDFWNDPQSKRLLTSTLDLLN